MNRRVTTGRQVGSIRPYEERPGNCDGGRLVRGLPAVVAGKACRGGRKKNRQN
ncbi:MAG: hypothetical protein HRF51_12940 [bacterium]